MGPRFRVCAINDVPEGEYRTFEIDGLEDPVLVANIGGAIHAVNSMCPHEEVSLDGGDLEGCWITCPGHAYEFDVTSGRCQHDEYLNLHRYRAIVVDDAVWIEAL